MERRTLGLLGITLLATIGSGCQHYCGPRACRPIFHRFGPVTPVRIAGPAISAPFAAPMGTSFDGPIYSGGGGGLSGPGCTNCATGASMSGLQLQPQPIYQLGGYPPSGAMMGSEPLGPPTILPPGGGPRVEIVPQPMPKLKN